MFNLSQDTTSMPDSLRAAVIKLAHAQPALRRPLLAVLREATGGPPTNLSDWKASPNLSSYTWSDGKTTIIIKRRDMGGFTYYILMALFDERFKSGHLKSKKSLQYKGKRGSANEWMKEAGIFYRIIQDYRDSDV